MSNSLVLVDFDIKDRAMGGDRIRIVVPGEIYGLLERSGWPFPTLRDLEVALSKLVNR